MGDDPPDKDSVTDQNIVAEDTTFCKRSCENNDSSARNPNKIQKTLFECGLWSCTFAKCTDEDNAEMLTCLKCKGKYHYRCTELPPYQIMQFISEGYTKYMCKSCIQVPDGLQKQCTIENDVVLENKSDPIKEKHDLCTQTCVSTDMTKLINERFDKIEKGIDQLVTQKILQHSPTAQVENLETKLDKVITNHQSYASKLSNKLEANNLASIMKETKNNDLIQEKQREMRSSNLVIYGIHEASEDETILKEQDESFISGFLGTIGVFSEPKQITRLGKLDESKRQRPMKIIMNSPKEKELVMSRLPNLQTADDIYRKCSVRDDYTYEERQLIKEWVKKAEEKNNNENTNTWKVRGTPKNGLRLVNTKRR